MSNPTKFCAKVGMSVLNQARLSIRCYQPQDLRQNSLYGIATFLPLRKASNKTKQKRLLFYKDIWSLFIYTSKNIQNSMCSSNLFKTDEMLQYFIHRVWDINNDLITDISRQNTLVDNATKNVVLSNSFLYFLGNHGCWV